MSLPKLDSLQATRALAAMLVMFYHANQHLEDAYGKNFFGNAFLYGFSGVDFFFVLSGFIITYSSHSLIGQPKRALEFARKRFVRIYPIYWFFLSGVLIVFWAYPSLVATPREYLSSGNLTKAYLLILGLKPILITSWTLSYEVLFYVCFLLLIVCKRPAMFIIASLLTLTVVASIYQVVAGQSLFQPRSPLTRLIHHANLEFLLGVLAFGSWKGLSIRAAWGGLVVGVGWFATGLFCVPLAQQSHVMETALTVLVYGMPSFLIIVSLVRLEIESKLSIPRPLVALGESSYTLYLVHTVVLTALRKVLMDKWHFMVINLSVTYSILIVLTLGICHITSVLVEMPLMRLVNRWLGGEKGPPNRSLKVTGLRAP